MDIKDKIILHIFEIPCAYNENVLLQLVGFPFVLATVLHSQVRENHN